MMNGLPEIVEEDNGTTVSVTIRKTWKGISVVNKMKHLTGTQKAADKFLSKMKVSRESILESIVTNVEGRIVCV
jgi:hypothetical protein